jgi:hypothetical protein
MNPAKTIFITIRDGEVAKNILLSGVYPSLQDHARIVIFVPQKKVSYFQKKFTAPNFYVEAIPRASFPRVEEAFSDLFLYSLHTKSIWTKIENSYFSGGSTTGRVVKKSLWYFGQWYFFRWFWRATYHFIPDHSFDRFFATYSPDLVFAANLIANEDVRLLKAARRFKITSVGMPKGWDNLTLKTFISVFPDWLLVQTELMKSDALSLDYPENRIVVVGFPKFDVYTKRELLIPREEFFKKLGLDPAKKTTLYAGAGDQLAPYDEEILRDFLAVVAAGKFGVPLQLIVRPHPKYHYRKEIIPASPDWVYDRPGTIVGTTEDDFEFEEKDIAHLMNSLAYCDLLIHTASTLGVEATIFDKPSIVISFDGSRRLPLALSSARYYQYVHYARVVAVGGMKVANSFDELVTYAGEYLLRPEIDQEGRARIFALNVEPFDGNAGKRVSEFLLAKLGK